MKRIKKDQIKSFCLRNRLFFIMLLVSLILGFVGELIFARFIGKKEVIDFKSSQVSEIDISKVQLNDLEWNSVTKTLTTTGADPFLSCEIEGGKNGAVVVDLQEKKTVCKDSVIQVFYGATTDSFSEAQSVRKLLASNQQKICIAYTPGEYGGIRIDLGSYAGVEFPIETIGVVQGDFTRTYVRGPFSVGLMLLWSFWCFTLISLIYCIWKKQPLEKIFLWAILFVGILYSVVLPPYSAPDEERHIMTTYKYASDLMGMKSSDGEEHAILYQEDAIADGTVYYRPNRVIYKALYGNGDTYATYVNREESISAQKIVDALPIRYLPQLIGMWIGRLFHMSWWGLLYIGRAFALLTYAILIYLALKIIPKGKHVMLAVAFLPISIELAVSFSYDATLIPLSILYTSYILHICFKEEYVTVREWITLGVIAVVFAFQKMVYLPLHGLLLMIPFCAKVKNKKWMKKIILLMCLAALTVALMKFLPYIISIFHPQKSQLASDTNLYIVGDFLRDPVSLIRIYYNTFIVYLDAFLQSTIGGSLGWLEIRLPWAMLMVFAVLIVYAVIADSSEKPFLNKPQKSYLWVLAFVMYLLIYASMLFLWTPNTSNVIIGVQGRYFLPFIPLMLLPFIGTNVRARKPITTIWVSAFIIQNIFSAWQVFTIVANR